MAKIKYRDPHAGKLASFIAVVRGGIKVRPNVQAFCDALEGELGYELSFGTYNGHSPPEGPAQAVDVFNTVSTAGYHQQDRIAEFAFANADKFKIRYVIRRHQIKNVERLPEGWREQGVTGDATQDHLDHTHLTFYYVEWDWVLPDMPTPVPVPVPKPIDDEENMINYVELLPGKHLIPVSGGPYIGQCYVTYASSGCQVSKAVAWPSQKPLNGLELGIGTAKDFSGRNYSEVESRDDSVEIWVDEGILWLKVETEK